MSTKATIKLAEFIQNLEYSDFSPQVVESARAALLDFMGAAIAGWRQGQLNRLLLDSLLQTDVSDDCTVLGGSQRASAVHAAMVNATSGHSLDLDDGHRQALGHPGVCVIPAALALGESVKSSGHQFLTAIVAGYDLFVRIGKAMNPAIFTRGFHTTGVCGTVAAAAAAAKILAFGQKKIGHALGIAALQSSGLLIVVHSGQMMKPLNAGKAAYNGVLSAILVRGEAVGPHDVLEATDGFGQAFAGDWDPAPLVSNLGSRFGITECYRKLYPSCRHSHAAIDAALSIKNANDINLEEIKAIRVTTYPAALKLTQKDKMPVDVPDTRFNLAFAVCLALTRGSAGLSDFSIDSVNDPQIRRLFEKTELVSDPAYESRKDNIRGAEVAVILADSTTLKKKTLLPRGEPENPATSRELKDKFRSCIGDFWPASKTEDVIGAIDAIDKMDDIRRLTELIRSDR